MTAIRLCHRTIVPRSALTRDHAGLLIRRLVAQRFPGDQVYGEEEGGATITRAGRRWIIDPINGTTLFARGLPGFDLLLAVERGDQLLDLVAGLPTGPRPHP